ncbi:hypothetical protein R3I94_012421 [Phoxinus phoxinus]
MAAAMQTTPAGEGDSVRLCSCGNKISCKDTHQVCSACLGLKHAQLAIENPGTCEHCARFTTKSLRRRLARQASLSGQDPLMTPSPSPAATPQVSIPVELPTMAALSWSEQLDVCMPLPGVLSTDEEEDALDLEEEGQSDFLLSDEEEDFEDSPFLPPAHPAQLLAAAGSTEEAGGAPSPPLLSVDLQDVCKRAAGKLNIPWPTVVAETAKSRYEGKRLPSAKRAARQLLPVFPELLEEVAVTWKDKPFTSKMPVQGGSVLDVEGMEKEGLLRMPPMEPLVAAHLQPRRTAAANPTLPSKADRFQSSMTERAYKAVALSVRAMNAISLLTAYQAELQDEVSTMPGQAHWEEISVVTDLSLRLQRCAVQAAGKAMATMVIQERGRWLNLANLSDREKEAILDAPVVAEGIFGSALTLMQRRCEEKKRDDEALQLCMPRKTQTAPPPPPRQTFAQAAARPPPTFRIPKRQRPYVNAAGQSGAQEQRSVWPKKNYPPAAAQTAQPASQPLPNPHLQGARRKKKTV